MEKIRNIVILGVEIIIVVTIIIFVTICIGTNSTENNYQKVLTLMNSRNFIEASKLVQEIPHYKDASELYIYIYPNSLYYGNYKTETDALKNYVLALNYIHLNKNSFKTKKYRDDFADLGKAISFKIDVIKAKKLNVGMDNTISECVNLIKKGDYLGAGAKLSTIINPSYDTIKTELTAYITFLNAVNLNNHWEIIKSIEGLDPMYNGILNSEISKGVFFYVDIIKWNTIYKKNKASTDSVSSVVTIGMKKNKIISVLGNPTVDNAIHSKYGAFEIMTYPNNIILYFEGGVLSAFKQ